MQELKAAWSTLVNVPVESMIIADKFSRIVANIKPHDLEAWLLLEIDRSDFRDWLPYSVSRPGHQIRTYYVNINPKSKSHQNELVIILHENTYAVIDEWAGEKLLSSTAAANQ